jgi:lipoprotein-releasing system permease protein
MAGFEDDLRDKILGANAHIVVTAYGGQGFEDPDALCAKVADVEGVAGVAPFVYGELLVRSALASSGAVVKGVDPVRTADVTSLRDSLVLGLQGEVTTHDARTAAMAALGEPVPARTDDDTPLPGLFIGVDMAETLGVLPGDDVQLVNPFGVGGGSLLGVPTPRVKRFRVAGLFRTGMFEYDSKWVHPVNSELTAFFGLPDGEVHGLEVRVHAPDDVRALSAGIEDALGYPYFARHWRELNQALFEALALEKVVMGLILFIVVLVAGMLVITNVYTLVRSKQREIAVLRAMGASAGLVMQVFLLVGSSIGGVGTVLGTALGLGLCAFLDWYQFPFDTDVYMLSSLPVVVKPTDVLTVAVATVSVCFLASVYPAMRAARLDPVAGLRAE